MSFRRIRKKNESRGTLYCVWVSSCDRQFSIRASRVAFCDDEHPIVLHDSVKPGDRVFVGLRPAKDGAHTGAFIKGTLANRKVAGGQQQDHSQ